MAHLYEELPNTSRSVIHTTEAACIQDNVLVLEMIEDGVSTQVELDRDDIQGGMTIQEFKNYLHRLNEKWVCIDLLFGCEMMFNKHFVSQYNLQQGDKITVLAMPVEDTSRDLQLSRSPRAAAVKAEAMTLMQQLQQSLREIKNTQKEQQ